LIIKHFPTDEDLAGDLLLAEAKFPLRRIMPQMQKKFQIALEKPDLKVNLYITKRLFVLMKKGEFL